VQNFLSMWSALDLRRRIVIGVATVAMFVAIIALSRMATAPGMALLYSGLDPAAAGEVVAALEQRGIAHEVRGGAILVDSAQRDSLRLTLAAEGLPAAGGGGYELLDGLSGFGTTSQMFDAAYWRAKEGELARTILAMPGIRAARVHISRADPQPFRAPERQTASVTITTAAGSVGAAQAKALRHLVAAAVAGMTPADVAVIDSAGGLVDDEDAVATPVVAAQSRSAELKRNVERLLEARVGPNNAIVEVSVDVVSETSTITERQFDPEGRVAISTETEDTSESSSEPADQVTVASNLPEGDAGAGAPSQSSSTGTKERVNFEVSETKREIVRGPGDIRRLSVAVLVGTVPVIADDGTVTQQARPAEELEVLRELVATAVGYDEARGDTITLRSLEFRAVAAEGTLAEAGMLAGLDMMSLIQIAVLAAVILVLGLFVLRPMLVSQRRAAPGEALALPSALAGPGIAPGREATRALDGEIDDGRPLPPLPVVSRDDTDLPADPVARLRRLIEVRQAESVEILRGWMEEREERT
jgi:flagellar M-ring protein FliF